MTRREMDVIAATDDLFTLEHRKPSTCSELEFAPLIGILATPHPPCGHLLPRGEGLRATDAGIRCYFISTPKCAIKTMARAETHQITFYGYLKDLSG